MFVMLAILNKKVLFTSIMILPGIIQENDPGNILWIAFGKSDL